MPTNDRPTDRLRTLIVDDEPLARARLRQLLAGEASVEIVGECGDGVEAVQAIRRESPDLVFLDIQLPGCDGLQVVSDLPPDRRPAVVFVTAHERYALEAFDVQAVDYLLKPFDRERLRVALSRATGHLGARRPEAPPRAERLAVKTDGKVVFVRPEEIEWIEAADNYVILHLADRNLMARETLANLEARLGSKRFLRVNRSALANLDQIREFRPAFYGDYVAILRNGARLPVSRSLRGQLGGFLTGKL